MIIQNGRKYELIEHETYRGGPFICENINCHKNARLFFLHWEDLVGYCSEECRRELWDREW